MCGMRVATGGAAAGVAVRGERRGATTGVGGWFGMKRRGAVGVMGGTLPGTLFLVCCECVRLVNFKTHFCVELGAFMIGGASVILVMVRAAGGSITLC
jgi:hypothetical protein